MTRLLRFAVPLLAVAGTADLATAGWNNVYQVTCFGCRQRSSSYYVQAPARIPTNVETISRYETETVTVMKPVRTTTVHSTAPPAPPAASPQGG